MKNKANKNGNRPEGHSCGFVDEMREVPAIASAIQTVKHLSPGQIRRTVFSAHSTAKLIGLEGASYVIRLPDTPPPGIWPLFALRRFAGGTAREPLRYFPPYDVEARRDTRCWLVDISFLPEMFPATPALPRAFCMAHFQAIDATGGALESRFPIQPPDREEKKLNPHKWGELLFCAHFECPKTIDVAQDVLLGCWYEVSETTKYCAGLEDLVAKASLAYLVYVRFQHEYPSGNGER